MIIVNLRTLELLEEWSEEDPTLRVKDAFPLYEGVGTENTAAVYFELEPGCALGTHTDSAEEILVILQGTVEVTLGNEQGRLAADELALIPRMVPHGVRNVGSSTARCLGFFASPSVVSTFEKPLMPTGERVFSTEQP